MAKLRSSTRDTTSSSPTPTTPTNTAESPPIAPQPEQPTNPTPIAESSHSDDSKTMLSATAVSKQPAKKRRSASTGASSSKSKGKKKANSAKQKDMAAESVASSSKTTAEIVTDELGENEFEVEEIRSMMREKGKAKYLVKWLNYPESENTWEPSTNLISRAPVKVFLDSLKKKSLWNFCTLTSGNSATPHWFPFDEASSSQIEDIFQEWLRNPTTETLHLVISELDYQVDFNRMILLKHQYPTEEPQYIRRTAK